MPVARRCKTNTASPNLLAGLVFDETGDRLSPSHAVKNGVRYRYYISHRLMQAARKDKDGWRLPAKELERHVTSALIDWLGAEEDLTDAIGLDRQTPSTARHALGRAKTIAHQLRTEATAETKAVLCTILQRVEVHPDTLTVELNLGALRRLLDVEDKPIDPVEGSTLSHRINVPHTLKRRGVEAKLVLGTGNHHRLPLKDENLIMAVGRAHDWLERLTNGSAASISELGEVTHEDPSEISRFLPLAFLAPDIVEAILSGRQPVDLTLERIRRIGELPSDWQGQRLALGFQN